MQKFEQQGYKCRAVGIWARVTEEVTWLKVQIDYIV